MYILIFTEIIIVTPLPLTTVQSVEIVILESPKHIRLLPIKVFFTFFHFHQGVLKNIRQIEEFQNFLYHTYICVVEKEFIPKLNTEHDGYAWVSFGHWPKPLHQGLRKTIQNKMNQMKLDTVFKMLKLMQ